MVFSRFFKFETRGVHQAALLLAFTSVANGVLGLVRDRLLAGTYGASRTLDVYYAAFRIPDIIFALSLFFVASTAFIPLFLEHQQRSKKEAKEFLDSVFTLFCLSMLACIALAYIFLPYLMKYIVPGFGYADQQDTLMLARIMLASPFLLGLSNLVSGVMQSSRKFLAYALSPIFYNLGIIFGVLVFLPLFGLKGLAFGVVLGAFLHFGIQVPTLIRIRSFPLLRLSWTVHPWDIVSFSFPRAFALSMNQFTLFILTALASTLGAGAIAVFTLSNNLYSLPLVIIGLSYSVAAFPLMAELALKEDKSIFFKHLTSSMRHILFWTLPITGLFIVLRAHIVRVVLGTGAFAWVDTRLTIASLLLFSFAIISQSLVTLFVRAFYALGKSREPVVYNFISSLVIACVAFFSARFLQSHESFVFFFSKILRVEGITQIEFLALPFAFSVGGIINAILLGRGLFQLNGKEAVSEVWESSKVITFIAFIMSIVAYGILQLFAAFFEPKGVPAFVLQGIVACAIAGCAGFYMCWHFSVKEFVELSAAFKGRFSKKDILQPETEHI